MSSHIQSQFEILKINLYNITYNKCIQVCNPEVKIKYY